jgi:hypothetical protein
LWSLLPIALLCITATASGAQAYSVPHHSLPEMISTSTVIALADIREVRSGPIEQRRVFAWGYEGPKARFKQPVTVEMKQAETNVLLVLKGAECVRDGMLQFRFPQHPPGTRAASIWFPEYQPGERWLLFLRTADDTLEPINQLGRQHLEIPNAMLLPLELRGPPQQKLERLLLWFLAYGQPDFTLACLEWLEYPSGWIAPQTEEDIAGLLQSAHPEIRLRAAMALCHARYAPAIPILVSECEARGWDDSLARRAIEMLRSCETPDALPHLHPLLTHENALVRQSAAYLLRQLADLSSVPRLVKALDDPDADVRYFAATALAAATGQRSFRVSADEFAGDEPTHLAHWKHWYQTGGLQESEKQKSLAALQAVAAITVDGRNEPLEEITLALRPWEPGLEPPQEPPPVEVNQRDYPARLEIRVPHMMWSAGDPSWVTTEPFHGSRLVRSIRVEQNSYGQAEARFQVMLKHPARVSGRSWAPPALELGLSLDPTADVQREDAYAVYLTQLMEPGEYIVARVQGDTPPWRVILDHVRDGPRTIQQQLADKGWHSELVLLPGGAAVQVGLFQSVEQAQARAAELEQAGFDAIVLTQKPYADPDAEHFRARPPTDLLATAPAAPSP